MRSLYPFPRPVYAALGTLLAAALCFAPASPALAEPPPALQAEAGPESGSVGLAGGVEKRVTKLGRGISNAALGWVELGLTVDADLRDRRSFAYLFGVSPLMGVARTVKRTLVGVVEIVTFPVPIPTESRRDGFDPLVEPAFVF